MAFGVNYGQAGPCQALARREARGDQAGLRTAHPFHANSTVPGTFRIGLESPDPLAVSPENPRNQRVGYLDKIRYEEQRNRLF
jgi:hypothetical protein